MTAFQEEMASLPHIDYQDLNELQEQVKRWADYNFGPTPAPYSRSLLGAMEELGELAHAHLKSDQGIRGLDDKDKAKAAKEDAIADLVIYLAHYCADNGLEFGRIVADTWNKEVRLRDWTVKPKFHAPPTVAKDVIFSPSNYDRNRAHAHLVIHHNMFPSDDEAWQRLYHMRQIGECECDTVAGISGLSVSVPKAREDRS